MWKSQLSRAAMFLLVIAYGSVINAQYQYWTTDIEKYSYLSLGAADLDISHLNKTVQKLGFPLFRIVHFLFSWVLRSLSSIWFLKAGLGNDFP